MIRSDHLNAKYIYSPHEVARWMATRRCFRHLNYAAIRSFIVAYVERADDSEKDPYRGRHGVSFERAAGKRIQELLTEMSGEFFSFRRERELRRREGYFYPPLLGHTWLHYWKARWFSSFDSRHDPQNPKDYHHVVTAARRLGVQCALCSKISRGDAAFTTNTELVFYWSDLYPWSWASGGRGRKLDDSEWYQHSIGRNWGLIRPLCETCSNEFAGADLRSPIRHMLVTMSQRLSA